ncbi:hypothetical protein SBRCBS47491_003590 [Sporothrix bragantina]|uniref:Polymer-forming cytoskeletal protein n=1 Tax=Sporothrix bragantina TaxID=671064 RepID=A0ABP0BGJ4_9PEZI
MPKSKSKRLLLPAPAKSTGDTGNSPSSSSSHQAPTISQAEYDEMLVTFANGDVDYNMQDHSMDNNAANAGVVKKKRSVKSNTSIHLNGPMEVDGSVKSMGSVTFLGDIAVRDKIEAYGNIEVSGNMTCQDKIKSFGNMDIAGYVCCTGKVKIFGKLTINGHFEVYDNIEVWGAVVIQGYMFVFPKSASPHCKTLTAYASVTTVGDDSYYEVEESETVWGAKMVRRTEGEA